MLALDSVDRALTAANVERLYRIRVRTLDAGGARRVFVPDTDDRVSR